MKHWRLTRVHSVYVETKTINIAIIAEDYENANCSVQYQRKP